MQSKGTPPGCLCFAEIMIGLTMNSVDSQRLLSSSFVMLTMGISFLGAISGLTAALCYGLNNPVQAHLFYMAPLAGSVIPPVTLLWLRARKYHDHPTATLRVGGKTFMGVSVLAWAVITGLLTSWSYAYGVNLNDGWRPEAENVIAPLATEAAAHHKYNDSLRRLGPDSRSLDFIASYPGSSLAQVELLLESAAPEESWDLVCNRRKTSAGRVRICFLSTDTTLGRARIKRETPSSVKLDLHFERLDRK